MRLLKSRKRSTPIKVEQTTLNKFFPDFSAPQINGLTSDEKSVISHFKESPYSLRMKRDGTIYIKETHCFDCGRRLVKNGHNPRIAILDKDLGRREFRLHRKRCPR